MKLQTVDSRGSNRVFSVTSRACSSAFNDLATRPGRETEGIRQSSLLTGIERADHIPRDTNLMIISPYEDLKKKSLQLFVPLLVV